MEEILAEVLTGRIRQAPGRRCSSIKAMRVCNDKGFSDAASPGCGFELLCIKKHRSFASIARWTKGGIDVLV